jgi:hypothetical protein
MGLGVDKTEGLLEEEKEWVKSQKWSRAQSVQKKSMNYAVPFKYEIRK